jgi:hypothetical protein
MFQAEIPPREDRVKISKKAEADYAAIATIWKDAPRAPSMSDAEVALVAKTIYKLGMGRAFKGVVKLTKGNRHTWVYRSIGRRPGAHSTKEMRVNYEKGWAEIIHGLSHYIHRRKPMKRRRKMPHSSQHSALELRLVRAVMSSIYFRDLRQKMIEKAIEAGPLDRSDIRKIAERMTAKRLRYQRVLARIKSWETKAKRAQTALRKLRRSRAAYERAGMVTT